MSWIKSFEGPNAAFQPGVEEPCLVLSGPKLVYLFYIDSEKLD